MHEFNKLMGFPCRISLSSVFRSFRNSLIPYHYACMNCKYFWKLRTLEVAQTQILIAHWAFHHWVVHILKQKNCWKKRNGFPDVLYCTSPFSPLPPLSNRASSALLTPPYGSSYGTAVKASVKEREAGHNSTDKPLNNQKRRLSVSARGLQTP